MDNTQPDAAATPSTDGRIADLLDQQNDLLRKITDALEKFAIGYRVLMSFEGRIEELEGHQRAPVPIRLPE